VASGRGQRIELGHADVAAEHLIERFRLFFIIALGETVLTMGAAFTGEPFELERLLALAIAFTGTVALWWCYEVVGSVPRSRPLGLAALAILAVATSPLTLIVGIAASSAVLVAVAIADTSGERDHPPRMSG
jgi:Bacterial low temperature requirement A protein (LtrA)